MGRGRLLLVTLCALAVIVGGWALTRNHPSPRAAQSASGVAASVCPITSLPHEVVDTISRIRAGGPFPFPRSDGAVFANYEGHLPKQRRGYYHEYTVITPRARDRSMRRIVTGGSPVAHPAQYFYTGNHYDSFCLVTGADGRP